MPNFERALGDALAGKSRLDVQMRNEQYRADIDDIKEFVKEHTGFRFVSVSVQKGDVTLLKLRAKEQD